MARIEEEVSCSPYARLLNIEANGPFTGKNENDNEKRELVFKEDGQEYAQVIKMLGNGRLEAKCFDGPLRLAHIRGKLRKKVWINQGDIILLSVPSLHLLGSVYS